MLILCLPRAPLTLQVSARGRADGRPVDQHQPPAKHVPQVISVTAARSLRVRVRACVRACVCVCV